jgi:hypothetical protein
MCGCFYCFYIFYDLSCFAFIFETGFGPTQLLILFVIAVLAEFTAATTP